MNSMVAKQACREMIMSDSNRFTTGLAVLSAFSTIGLLIVGVLTYQLSNRLAEYEQAKFSYRAELSDGNLLIQNLGDDELAPQSVRAIPIFRNQTELDPKDEGISIPIREVKRNSDGVKVFQNIVEVICKSAKYSKRCHEAGKPTLLTVVFRFKDVEKREPLAF